MPANQAMAVFYRTGNEVLQALSLSVSPALIPGMNADLHHPIDYASDTFTKLRRPFGVRATRDGHEEVVSACPTPAQATSPPTAKPIGGPEGLEVEVDILRDTHLRDPEPRQGSCKGLLKHTVFVDVPVGVDVGNLQPHVAKACDLRGGFASHVLHINATLHNSPQEIAGGIKTATGTHKSCDVLGITYRLLVLIRDVHQMHPEADIRVPHCISDRGMGGRSVGHDRGACQNAGVEASDGGFGALRIKPKVIRMSNQPHNDRTNSFRAEKGFARTTEMSP